MRVLQPKDGQTYLYFYEDSMLNPSQNISLAKKLLKELGCKIGPAWKREQPEYHICTCEKGEFRLVNDVLAIYIESEKSEVISFLAKGLEVVCHKYKKGCEIRMTDGYSATIEDYIKEDYIVATASGDKQITEDDIVCKKLIPDDIIGKNVTVSLWDPDMGELEEYTGTVKATEMSGKVLSVTVEVVWADDEDDPCIFEHTIYEDEIKKITVID